MSDEGPYEGWSIPAIIHNYVVIRGDLSEQYARDQLADLIAERIAQARREGAAELEDAVVAMRSATSVGPGCYTDEGWHALCQRLLARVDALRGDA